MRFSNKFYSNYLQITWGIFEKIKNFLDFLAVMVDYGYDDARIQQGRDLYTGLHNYHQLYLEKRQATLSKMRAFNKMFRQVFKEYANFVKRLRTELRNDLETRTVLGVKGNRERTISGFIDQATNFYNMAMKSETFSKIQRFGFTLELLQIGLRHIGELHDFHIICESMSGECQELVEKRYQAYVKLRDWMTAFITASKVAYEGNLQTLEKLGMFILNRPRPKVEDEHPEIPAAVTAPEAPAASAAPATHAAPIAEENNAAQVTQVSEPAN